MRIFLDLLAMIFLMASVTLNYTEYYLTNDTHLFLLFIGWCISYGLCLLNEHFYPVKLGE